MKPQPARKPRCIIIAGPNGAGKTTFAREFLPKEAAVVNFVNADLIAVGLSPLRPELAALAGGRLFLAQLDRLARARADFAFETTLSGLVYLNRLLRLASLGLPHRDHLSPLAISPTGLAARRCARPAGWPQCPASRCPAALSPQLAEFQ